MRALIALVFVLGCSKKRDEPPPAPASRSVAAPCEEYRDALQAIVRCETVPRMFRDATRLDVEQADRLLQKLATLPREEADAIEEGCRRDAKKLREIPCEKSLLPPACQEYRTKLARFVTCEALAADARQDARRKLDRLEVARTEATPSEQASIEPMCKAALDVLRERGEPCGP